MIAARNPTAEMQSLAEYAVRNAKSKFGQSLDYSRRTLPALDTLLIQAYDRFCVLDNQGRLTDEAIMHTARIWGGYLGEVIRRIWGGQWSLQDGEPVLVIGGLKVEPVKAALGPMTDPDCEPASAWFDRVGEQLDFRELKPLANAGLLDSLTSLRTRLPTIEIPHIPRWVYLGVLVFGLLLLLIAAINPAIKAFQAWQFNSSFGRFVAEGQKLAAMSGPELDVTAFRDQLGRVKSAYARTGDGWPITYALRKIQYAEALRGWDLAMSVWDFGQTTGPAPFSGQGEAPGELLKKSCAYTGVGFHTGAELSTQEWFATLIAAAGKQFSAAGTGL
jgi:hypothetical protein